MFEVRCPECQERRMVAARKPWMKGEAPYEKICKSCCQVGKVKTEDHLRKLSDSVKKAQTPELLKKKSQFMRDHPELWENLQPELGSEAWAGQHHTEEAKEAMSKAMQGRSVSLKTRAKISKSMKKLKKGE